MAKATKITPKPVKQPPATYTLELSEGEADFILGIMGDIGGHPARSPRKYAVSLEKALSEAAGYKWDETDAYKLISRTSFSDGIFFKDYSAL